MMIKLLRRLFRRDTHAGQTEINKEVVKRYLIVCLGNIGPEYEGTRHNVGFMVGDTIADDAGIGFKSCRYGDMAEVKVKNCEPAFAETLHFYESKRRGCAFLDE